MPTKATTLAITVAVAEPAMPMAGIGPSPRMKTGLSPLSSTTETIMNQSGESESPVPRRPIIMMIAISMNGIAMKMTRR